jgi:hypothetical protein
LPALKIAFHSCGLPLVKNTCRIRTHVSVTKCSSTYEYACVEAYWKRGLLTNDQPEAQHTLL